MMVMGSGTDADRNVTMEGLPVRVQHLEGVVDSLHQDSIRTQAQLSSLDMQMRNLNDTLKDFGSKLDVARTKKPDMAAFGTWATVLLMFMGMASAGFIFRMSQHERFLETLNARQIENIEIIGAYKEDKANVHKQLDALQKQAVDIMNNRFTKDDGQRTEDRINRLHDDKPRD